jgi:hypothetical protein
MVDVFVEKWRMKSGEKDGRGEFCSKVFQGLINEGRSRSSDSDASTFDINESKKLEKDVLRVL